MRAATAHGGDTVQFDLLVTNTGNTALNTVTVTDTFPSCLAYSSATPSPDTVGSGTLTWNDITGAGSLAVGASTTISVSFAAVSTSSPARWRRPVSTVPVFSPLTLAALCGVMLAIGVWRLRRVAQR